MSKVYSNYAASISPKKAVTSQSKVIPGREQEMAQNNANGYTFLLDVWGILDRTLVLGTEDGNYYVGEKDLTKVAFSNAISCIHKDGLRVVQRVLEYSTSGRAPKNDPALVVLALAAVHGTPAVQSAAFEALPVVARTGTHLFTFISVLNSLGKWNSVAKRGIAAWYTNRSSERLAHQLLKYQSRNGWSHRDVLRLAHVKPKNSEQDALFHWVTKNHAHKEGLELPKLVQNFEALHLATSAKEVVRIIGDNQDISWELVPTQFLKDKDVLMALLPSMGLTAIIRQLGKLSAAGVLNPMSEGQKLVLAKLSDATELKAQRVHPIFILQAFKQYQAGHGERGTLSWGTNQRVLDALDDAFYAAFSNVENTGAGLFLGVDCSGSMFTTKVNGSPNLVAAEVAAVLALAIVKNQTNYWIGGFNTKMSELKISPKMRLNAVLEIIRSFSWGGTDCAQPMLHAAEHGMSNIDAFVTITDNETWAGHIQPTQALRNYRQKFNKPKASNIVIGTSVSSFTIADPKDPFQIDVAGFDSATPQIIDHYLRQAV